MDFGAGAVLLEENGLSLTGGACLKFRWNADKTPFIGATENALTYEFNGRRYLLRVTRGRVVSGDEPLLMPSDGVLALAFERLGQKN